MSEASSRAPYRYRRYVLLVLTLTYTINLLDSGLMILLLQPIKNDLSLSDSQLGFLTGIAFALFYATLGLPIARWADRGNRSTITALAIGVWGMTIMLCLFVKNFAQLVIARIAAGVGEAGCLPPTYSLLGDYFPGAAERTRAITVYMLANPLSAFASLALGGWLNEHYGWRMTFFLMGTPALLASVLIKVTVRDPRFQSASAPPSVSTMLVTQDGSLSGTPRLMQVLKLLWVQRSSRHLTLALVLLYTMGAGLGPWYAAFLMRSHGMGTKEVGLWLGSVVGFSAGMGTFVGGFVSARWFARDERLQMRLSAATIAAVIPCFAAFLLLPGKYEALLALVPLMMVFNVFNGPAFALLQRLVEPRMRATALAVVMLLANLIGMGIGPQIVGALSDGLQPISGPDSLRYAMLATTSIALLAAFYFWTVGRTVQSDLSEMGYR